MKGRDGNAEAVITIEGRQYALFRKGKWSKYPYMIDLTTGGIPDGQQRPLLMEFMLQNRISMEPYTQKTIHTHECVKRVIKWMQG